MVNKAAVEATRLEPDHPFRALYKQGARRWVVLVVSFALLTWLGFFAGMVRNPGGVKRPWAVIASRAMAAAGAVLVARLLLFSYEERVPVLYLRLEAGGEEGKAFLHSSAARRQATIPLRDLEAFIAQRRYVPKGGVGLVLRAGSLAELDALGQALGSIHATVLLPPGALSGEPEDQTGKLGSAVEIGVALDLEADNSREGLLSALRDFAERSLAYTGKRPVCAVMRGTSPDPKGLAEASGYACFLGGRGYNRFGDNPYLVRLLDITPVLRLGKLTGLNIKAYTGLFRGRYMWWPLAALLRAFGASPGWD